MILYYIIIIIQTCKKVIMIKTLSLETLPIEPVPIEHLPIELFCNYLSEDIVKYIFSFDNRIVFRNGLIYFVNKIDKVAYQESYKVLSKRRFVKEGRTTTWNGVIFTWCTLPLDKNHKFYISYASNSKGDLICSLDVWKANGKYTKTTFDFANKETKNLTNY